jgi:threonine dehydrogenase-like Zn-dependent dehydrogenase
MRIPNGKDIDMRATVLHGIGDVRLEEVADPTIHHPTDAVVTVIAACICGSDLHPYRGDNPTTFPKRAGHEFVGRVAAVGSDVSRVAVGDFVIAPFAISDDTCVHCRNGITTSCAQGSYWGYPDRTGVLADGGQGEHIRVPLADGTLVRVGPDELDTTTVPDLLALSDVMGTGHHAAVSAGVTSGSTVVVIGDGAVGLCATLAAVRLGAERVIVMSRHENRQKLALEFGATDIVPERGDDGAARVQELLSGIGADSTLECVGTPESFAQALGVTRPGGAVGSVGGTSFEVPVPTLFSRNIGLRGGVAPVRAYLPDLLTDVLAGKIRPGKIFDLELPLDSVAEGYTAMDERRAIKVLLRP